MADLQIKTESPPDRCEVCHQADCFDASRNYCSRCAGIARPAIISGNKYDAALVARGWLYRALDVTTPRGVFRIIYDGKGMGYESVMVDGKIASRRSGAWFVPEFIFMIDALPARVCVQVRPWLAIRSFSLEVDGQTIYREGGF
jgi:hypothetical protein